MKNNNKISFCISFVIFLLFFANIAEAENFEIGVRYNPEFTCLLNKNDNNAGRALGYTSNFAYYSYGAGAIFNFNSNLGLAADILFSREGQRFAGTFNGDPVDAATYSSVVNRQAIQNNIVITGNYVAKSELNYIKLPIMFSVTSDNTGLFFFTLLVGPQINFLSSVAQEINHNDTDYPNSNITSKNLYKSITFDGVIALGSSYNISNNMVLSARLRLDYGFSDVENKALMVSYSGATPVSFYSPNRQATHNLTIGLILGLDFKL